VVAELLRLFRHIWAALANRPQVTGDTKHLTAQWWPESHSLDGERLTSGIKICITCKFTLANDGPVATGIKDVYMEITHGRKNIYRLECYTPESIEEGIRIEPTDVWRSEGVGFSGFIPEIDEPPKSLKCKFVVEAAGQRPFRKNLKLPAIVRTMK
jgi:hypothetical protein